MGLGASTIKYSLLLLNCLFVPLGLLLILLGIFHVLTADQLELNHGKNLIEAFIIALFSFIIKVIGGIIIAIGALVSILAIFGCWTAIRESKVKLVFYASSLTILIVAELLLLSIGVIQMGSKQNDASDKVNEEFDQLWLKEKYEPSALAGLENLLQCCGVNSTDDYRLIGHEIPKTCCKDQNCAILENIYQEGCRSKYEEYIYMRASLFNIIIICLILLEVVAVVFSWLSYMNLNNETRRLKQRDL